MKEKTQRKAVKFKRSASSEWEGGIGYYDGDRLLMISTKDGETIMTWSKVKPA